MRMYGKRERILARTRELGCLSASPVLTAPATDASVVKRARLATSTLSTASTPEAEVGLASGVVSAELTVVGEATSRAPVVDTETRSAALVLVAVRSDTFDCITLAVGAEATVSALGRLGASRVVGQRLVGNAPLVDTVSIDATRVLVAVSTAWLDVLA